MQKLEIYPNHIDKSLFKKVLAYLTAERVSYKNSKNKNLPININSNYGTISNK